MKIIKLVANKAIRQSDETDYYIYDSDTGKPVAEWLNSAGAERDVDLRNKAVGRERYYIRSITHRAGTLENPEKKRFTYKGFICIWNDVIKAYEVFTRDEMKQPRGFRYAEMECETKKICKEFIDSY